ncbi:hypothetical protein HPP92_026198 [Vanilla planifolia]|uniref:Aminotransferase class I/classII large domain-containing protein n=2 Tax=Vanilla planifolia TaxID=51239 RepID=A0A835U8N0_VANPL|nr:hypothetical protein HPP92_026198 [Vanilla planifolia]
MAPTSKDSISSSMEEKSKNGMATSKPRLLVGCNPLLLQMKTSIRGVMAELKAAANPAKSVISLGTGDLAIYSDYFGKRRAFGDAVAAASAHFDSYLPAFGLPSARRAVAEYITNVVRKCRISRSDPPLKVTESDVFLTVGATQALQTTLTVLASAGGNVLLPRPGFALYDSACKLAGVGCRYYDLLPSRRWEADPSQIRSLADANTLAIVVINPNNPTGAAFSSHHLFQIAEIARDLCIPIIADELAVQAVDGSRMASRLVSDLRSAGDPSKVREATEMIMNINPGPASVIQAAVPAILSDENEEFHANVVQLLESCVDALFKGLKQIEALKCYSRPQGSIFVMVEIDTSRLLGIENDMDFAKQLMKEESVLVLPGFVLGCKNWVRLFFGLPNDLLMEACKRMRSFCQRRMV